MSTDKLNPHILYLNRLNLDTRNDIALVTRRPENLFYHCICTLIGDDHLECYTVLWQSRGSSQTLPLRDAVYADDNTIGCVFALLAALPKQGFECRICKIPAGNGGAPRNFKPVNFEKVKLGKAVQSSRFKNFVGDKVEFLSICGTRGTVVKNSIDPRPCLTLCNNLATNNTANSIYKTLNMLDVVLNLYTVLTIAA